KGTPHAMFNAPATEFVARFMGGHNVVTTPAGKVAVRTDRTKLTRGAGERAGFVTAAEYQGTHVHVAVRGPDNTDYVALVPDAVFDADPLTPGSVVALDWDPADAHPLQ
ncbi:TOBE domain-containing protein, partial [Mycobacterium tuberculosis]|nr:TOBE domain-containing protein [Mycobacterium tuberculosis]